MTTSPPSPDPSLTAEITALEHRLAALRAQLPPSSNPPSLPSSQPPQQTLTSIPPPTLHPLLTLSDSALPLGSFAYSAGLESYLAHTPRHLHTRPSTFQHFLDLSLRSVASTTLPYARAAHQFPGHLARWDDECDASTTCAVARRASVGQGRALVGVWERSLRGAMSTFPAAEGESARAALDAFAVALKAAPAPAEGVMAWWEDGVPVVRANGHLPPLFGVLAAAMGLPLAHALYVFLLNHAKTLVSAGIRASVLGPYQAQGVLAGERLRSRLWALVEEELALGLGLDEGSLERVGQSVPVLDLWGGRHEIVYSRIFNS